MYVYKPYISLHPSIHTEVARPRFSEWSYATLEFQKDFLNDSENCDYDFSFLGLFHSDDHKHMTSNKDTVAGKMMTGWWDTSSDAGPATRPQSRFEEQPPELEVLTLVDGEVKNFGMVYSVVFLIYCFL